MGLDQAMRDLLQQPRQEFHFTIPVKMDDGSTRVFNGFRVHITTPGDQERVASDSIPKRQWTPSGSCHVDDLEMCGSGHSLGGARGGIVCDPRELSPGEQERLCRGYVRQLART